MYRATTPTHKFTFDFSVSDMTAIELTYAQNGATKFSKSKADLTISTDGKTVEYKLTLQESKMLNEGYANIQFRFKTSEDSIFASDIITINVNKPLSEANL